MMKRPVPVAYSLRVADDKASMMKRPMPVAYLLRVEDDEASGACGVFVEGGG